MWRSLVWATATAAAFLPTPIRADSGLLSREGPASKRIDIAVHAASGALTDCTLTGEALLWVSRRVEVQEGPHARVGAAMAGLAQFGTGSRLGGCVPDGAQLNLSEQFATFVVAERSDAAARREAISIASRLAQEHWQLVDVDGTVIPAADGITLRAAGSTSYRFRIVLVVDAGPGPVDVVILRETLGTKFAPRLADADRRTSRLKWASLP